MNRWREGLQEKERWSEDESKGEKGKKIGKKRSCFSFSKNGHVT